MGIPYAPYILETAEPEKLVINLREMDCVTFVENALVLAMLIKNGKLTFDDYAFLLQTVRYRKGAVSEYVSRLHYFSDWIFDNQRKGLLANVTRSLGGRTLSKKLHFMTTYREQYPALGSEDIFRKIRAVEKNISRRLLYYIPKSRLPHIEKKIIDGDLIAITTNIEGLDIAHVGFAICLKGKVHLLNASKVKGKVTISDEPLQCYLASHKTYSGIMVARIL
jgi:hypothetical protein